MCLFLSYSVFLKYYLFNSFKFWQSLSVFKSTAIPTSEPTKPLLRLTLWWQWTLEKKGEVLPPAQEVNGDWF